MSNKQLAKIMPICIAVLFTVGIWLLLMLIGVAKSEEPKVYTENDLKGYSSEPMAVEDPKFTKLKEGYRRENKLKEDEQKREEIQKIDEKNRKIEKERYERRAEEALRIERDKVRAMEDYNRRILY